MFIDVRFDRALAIDRVDVVSHDPQWESRMDVSVLAASGEWKPAAQPSWRSGPPPDLRQEATQAIKRSGIRFIEMRSEAWSQKPFRADCAAWGVRHVASAPHSVLLAVD
jgi:hypothetical protein